MAVSVTHAFTSAIADDPVAQAAGEVLPSHWNAAHTIVGLGTAAEANIGDFAAASHTHAVADITDYVAMTRRIVSLRL